MRLGVHTSVRRGFAAAAETAAALGCGTLQIFTQSPSDGSIPKVFDDAEYVAFRDARRRHGLAPVVIHTPYLPNLCTSDEAMYRRSIRALKDDLVRAEKLGGEFLVIHPGSYSPGETLETGLDRIAAALREGLDAVAGTARVLIENMAGGGRRIGGPFRELGEILRRTNRPDRLGVCFDTCHAYAAGYDLSSGAGVAAALDEFDREVGLDQIFVFHVNDSAGELNGHRDLHENLGAGRIGLAGLTALFRHPAFARCALILETPKDPAPAADLDNLRRLRQCVPAGEAT